MPGFMSKIGELLGGSAGEIVESVGATVDRFVNTGEEKAAAELLKRELELKFKTLETDVEKAYLSDRQSARKMFAHDSSTQKILTIVFTVGYFGLTAVMFGFLMKMLEVDLNDFVVAFISSIFGSFSAIMATIVAFYFGSSQSGENQSEKIASAFENGTTQKE